MRNCHFGNGNLHTYLRLFPFHQCCKVRFLPFRILHVFVQHGASLAIRRVLARQRILDCAKVGKGKRTVSDLGVRSYAQGAVAEAGVAVGCVSTSRRYSHASEKATQSGEDRPHDPVPDSCDSGRGIKLGDSWRRFPKPYIAATVSTGRTTVSKTVALCTTRLSIPYRKNIRENCL